MTPDTRARLFGAATAARNRLAAAGRRSATRLGAHPRGRAAGSLLPGALASARRALHTEGHDLQRLLSRVLLADTTGDPVPAEQLDELRRMAIGYRTDDPDGIALATFGVLAERFADPAAAAWLPPALAEAGRFAEAAELDLTFAPGRPPAGNYLILVTALAELGRMADAEEMVRFLQRKFRGLRRDAVHIWGDDPLSRSYRALYHRSPARSGALPVFQHLPFCAGSSMQHALKQVVPSGRTLQIGRRWGLLQIEQALQLSAEDAGRLMMVHQHHPYPLPLPGRRLSHFTVLRDPVSQIRSGFFKRQARENIVGTRDVASTSFAEHARYTMSHGLTNMLARMIVTTHPDLQDVYRRRFDSSGAFTMITHEEDMYWLRATRRLTESRLLAMCRETLDHNFQVVGTMAHLSASHLACTATVGVPVAHMVGHRGRSGQPREVDPDRLETRLREANAVDQQLYEEYTRRFEDDHPELIAAVEGGTGTDRLEERAITQPDRYRSVGESPTARSATEGLEQLGDGVAVVQ